MTTSDGPRPWQEALGEIYRRAATDSSFRALCLADPKAAFAAVGPYEYPTDVKLRFMEKPDEVVFVLPPLVADGMSDAELDMVAGGGVVDNGSYWPDGLTSVYEAPAAPPAPMAGPMPGGFYGYGYGYGWAGGPDPRTASGYPPLVKPGGPPPGY